MTVPYLIRETFRGADGRSGELAATGLVLASLVALMLMQPLGGALSDRIGRKPLLVAFGALGLMGAGVLVTVAAQVTSPPAATWPLWVEDLDDDSPARQLRLGFDTGGRLLELVVLRFDSPNELIIHSMKARPQMFDLLPRGGRASERQAGALGRLAG